MQENRFEKTPLSIIRIIAIQVLYWSGFLFFIPQVLIRLIITLQIIPSSSLLFYVQWFTYLLSAIFAILLAFPLLKKEFNLKLEKVIFTVIICVVAMYVCNVLFTIGMQFLNGPITSNNQQALTSQVELNIPLYVIMTVVFAPILEEIVFRGGIFRSLRFKLGFFHSAIISSVLFGFIHVSASFFAGDYQDVIYIILYGGLGFAFAFAYEYNKSIYACIIVHALYNLIGMLPFIIG